MHKLQEEEGGKKKEGKKGHHVLKMIIKIKRIKIIAPIK